MKRTLLIFAILCVLTTISAQAQSYVVIVNNNNAVTELTKAELSEIFLKTKVRWDDGVSIIPVDLNARSTVREDFTQEIHGRRVAAIRTHWQQAAFSGGGTAPPERNSDADVIQFVRDNPGAIGYISSETPPTGVKVIIVK
ncbi:MAG: hypothetical protein JJU41_07800 [Bacteroidetes bacterium]|nr:hypothetical protein [Bacteroidota bacterium]MCH8524235.1 hypothetical protein [Balneolales bacterium]